MLIVRKSGLLRWAGRVSLAILFGGGVAGAVALYAAPPKVATRTESLDAKPPAVTTVPTPTAVKGAPAAKHPLLPAIEIAKQNRKVAVALKDYAATFSKRERIGRQLLQQTMFMKFRAEPMSVYMKFLAPNAGREVLYVAGQNNDQLLVHETGFRGLAGTLSFPLNHPTVMAENRHPMNQLGFVNLLNLQIAQWELETKYNETDVKISDVKLGEQTCQLIETSHPQARKQFRFQKQKLYFDAQTKLPARVESYGFPGTAGEESPLMEEYTYTNVQTNLGFTDADFSRRNRQYGF